MYSSLMIIGRNRLPHGLGRIGALATVVLGCCGAWAQTPLEVYDAAIAADGATLPPVATLTTAVALSGSGGSPFDFGESTGDATIEFIVQGNPGASSSSYLAVGATAASSLRYEAWDNTAELGFTQGGVADYRFAPGVPSPVEATHIAYVWDPATQVMMLYVNGSLAGSTTGVAAEFAMPSGAGRLGSNANGDEAMAGTIHRVTVYDTALPAQVIKRHASAFGAHVSKALAAYDASVTADAGTGLTPTATLTSTVVLNGTGGADFDFGANADDVTMEFILEGDTDFGTGAYLAVGENSGSNLRYEAWGAPNQIGFTLLGVADYSFSPGVAAPTLPTHVTYVWNATTLTMKAYVNGVLAGTAAGISDGFAMPYGVGKLGCNPSLLEPMAGTIYRVTAYDSLLDDATILRHAKAFADLLSPPTIVSFTVTPAAVAAGQSATLNWEVKNATKVLVNGVDQTGAKSLTVSVPLSSTYTLTAENSLGKVTKTVRLQVNPDLSGYDAAIAADTQAGLTPVAKLNAQVALAGDWAGVPFDFGATSGDVTMEFILEGEPTSGSGIAIATDSDDTGLWRHSLRYSQMGGDGQLGFTKRAVLDYTFSTPVPASSWPTHVTFVWDSTALVMSVYVNGALAGSRAEVDPEFAMPTGLGKLGEGMVGTIFRVNAYAGKLSEARIQSHAKAFVAQAAPALNTYDAAIATDTAGGLQPLARLYAPVTLTGSAGVTFDFGAGEGSETFEFILEGNPAANVSGFLAVASGSSSSLRYKVWGSPDVLGFTQIAVADYQFDPTVPAPTKATHIAYVWNADNLAMDLYVNGKLAGSTTGVSDAFLMPAGPGLLGAGSLTGSEGMVGTMHRVTVYDSIVAPEVLLRHARAFVGADTTPPVLAVSVAGNSPVLSLSQGVTGAHYRVEYRDSLGSADAWQLLQDIPSLSGPTVQVPDATSVAGRTARFYRAVLVQ